MIQTSPLPRCPVCDHGGTALHQGLTDQLYRTEGIWSMRTCENPVCRTCWLDPAPLPADLHKLYATYSTHTQASASIMPSGTHSFLDRIRESVLGKTLGYPRTRKSSLFDLIVSRAHPAWRDAQQAMVFYLPHVSEGRMLDIGCGNGSSMLVLRQYGWSVEGIDFDEHSIAQARARHLNAKVGDLRMINYPTGSFDAILMNHVIEHIPNPVDLLRECLRILKPGGVLVALTPNADSWGHRRFGSCWRGLEIPRHLHIFTWDSLALAARQAGFTSVESFTSTQGIVQIYDESAHCKRHGDFSMPIASSGSRIYSHIRLFIAGWRHFFLPKFSEVAVLRATKSKN